jgi:glycosyltransferase involved in cell wall biosynthesis
MLPPPIPDAIPGDPDPACIPHAERSRRLRVLYSFPHPIGGPRIGSTAWYQVRALEEAGADLIVCTPSLARPLPPQVQVWRTLSRGPLRLPFRVIGRKRAIALHDHIVAQRLTALAGKIDLVHVWPLGALATLRVARELDIPTVLERPNAHTRFAYDAVQKECLRLGIVLPRGDSHAYQPDVLEREEEEYRLATRLLCASAFSERSFLDQGFSSGQLERHFYGYDETMFHSDSRASNSADHFTMLFVGVCAVRKGLHIALEAWLNSSARLNGTFLIAGEVLPAYRRKLAAQLSHPSVRVLGHRTDIPALMRRSCVLVLPSIEEGFGLVCTEAMASGCVPLVSNACTDLCKHGHNALVHRVRDVNALTSHITLLDQNPSVLQKLRAAGLETSPAITWTQAGKKLLEIYRDVVRKTAESHTHAPPYEDRFT